MAFSPDGKIFAVGGRQFLRLFRADTGLELKPHADDKEEPEFVTALAFSPDGKDVAAGTGPGENSVRLWDLETGQRRTILQGDPTYDVTSTVFSPDARMLIATSYDGLIRMFDFRTRKPSIVGRHIFNGYSQGALCAAINLSGTKLATEGVDHTIKLWDVSINKKTGYLLLRNIRFCVDIRTRLMRGAFFRRKESFFPPTGSGSISQERLRYGM